MEDLNQQINQILSDPQSMQQLQSMAAALGLGGQSGAAQPARQQPTPPQAAQNSQPDLSGLLRSLSGPGGGNASPPPASGGLSGLSPELLQTVGRLAPLLSQANREDDSTRLLRALRPLLSAARQQKLDEAIKILQMMRLLPLLRSSGLGSLLF